MSDTLQESPVENFAGDSPNGGGSRKLLLILAGVAGLVVLGAAVYFLFLSGGSEEELGTVPTAQPPSSSAQPNGKNGGKDDNTLPQAVDKNFKVGTDPFKPLPAEKLKDTSTGTGTGTSTDTGTGTSTGTGTGTGTGSGTGTGTVTSYTVGVTSVDVAKGTAQLQVNGEDMTVKVDQVFPDAKTGPLKLVAVTSNAAKIQLGSGMVLTLNVGKSTVFTPPTS